MTRRVDVDYLVVGAGAMGMGFTDALIEHSPQVRVALVDRRHGVGGHWLEDYSFVRLHQASSFYGVASTVLGGYRVQTGGPEAGLWERADQPTIVSYYADLLADRMVGPGRVDHFPGCEYVGDRQFVSRISGERYEVPERCRIVDARYLAPDIPAETPPQSRSRRVRESSRSTSWYASTRPPASTSWWGPARPRPTPACGCRRVVSIRTPSAGCVRASPGCSTAHSSSRPRHLSPLLATLLELATTAESLDQLFLHLEDAGIMLRLDRSVTPTMAKAPTLGLWELDLLRSIENVVRLGRRRSARRGRLELDEGSVGIADDAVIVNCAADGLKMPPRVSIWSPDAITLQSVRAGFPCFGAAITGCVEATRSADDEKNRLCPPASFGNTLSDWARMNTIGMRNVASFSTEPDIKDWSDRVAVNAARVPPERATEPAVSEAVARMRGATPAAVARLDELSA